MTKVSVAGVVLFFFASCAGSAAGYVDVSDLCAEADSAVVCALVHTQNAEHISPTPTYTDRYETPLAQNPPHTPDDDCGTVPDAYATPRTFVVAIDPGHQGRGNYATEPIGPGSAQYRPMVATGTRGVSTGIPQHQLNLEVSLMLADALVAAGFGVFLVRGCADVDISNSQRALMAYAIGADILVRIHANGAENPDIHGILTINKTAANPYAPHLYAPSRALSEHLLYALVAATGAQNRGIIESDSFSGNNWSRVPVSIIEMGFMTNPQEDERMNTQEYREMLVRGMVTGITAFFDDMVTQWNLQQQ